MMSIGLFETSVWNGKNRNIAVDKASKYLKLK